MVRRARPNPKPQRGRHFIREWRFYRGDMSQETLSEKLQELAGFSMSPGQISRVENRESPYGQDLLEALAVVFQCEVKDIVGRDPSLPEAPRSVLDTLRPQTREVIEDMISTYAAKEEAERRKGTGTEG